MVKLKFEDIEELGVAVLNAYNDACKRDDYPSVGVSGHYEVISKLANYILHKCHDINLSYAEFGDSYVDGYNDEFFLEIDYEGNMWLEKSYLKDKDAYLSTDDTHMFIHSDCNSRLLKALDKCDCVEFCVTELDGEEDADYEHSKKIVTDYDEDIEMHTISKSETVDDKYSYTSITCSDKSLIDKIAKKWNLI